MATYLPESVDDFGELVLVADIWDNAGGTVSSSFSTEYRIYYGGNSIRVKIQNNG